MKFVGVRNSTFPVQQNVLATAPLSVFVANSAILSNDYISLLIYFLYVYVHKCCWWSDWSTKLQCYWDCESSTLLETAVSAELGVAAPCCWRWALWWGYSLLLPRLDNVFFDLFFFLCWFVLLFTLSFLITTVSLSTPLVKMRYREMPWSHRCPCLCFSATLTTICLPSLCSILMDC